MTMMLSLLRRRLLPTRAPARIFSSSSSSTINDGGIIGGSRGRGKIVMKQPQLIKTNVEEHFAYLKSQRLDPNKTLSLLDEADPSGVMPKDLTDEVLDLKTMFDPRIHLASAPDWIKDGYEAATPLTQVLVQDMAVRAKPITVAEYMRQALTHELYGYYTNPTQPDNDDDWDNDGSDFDDDVITNDATNSAAAGATSPDEYIIGSKGDFVTAPEISQVFGEMLSVWFVTQWQTLFKPNKVQLVEVGPGKGTLMADLLRACLVSFTGMGDAIQAVHLIEASSAMRQEQRRKLEALKVGENVKFDFGDDDKNDKAESVVASDKTDNDEESSDTPPTRIINVSWHDNFTSFSVSQRKESMPTFVVCQEFIDALPVHAFQKTENGWRERMVNVASKLDEEDAKEEEGKDKENKSDKPSTEPLKQQQVVENNDDDDDLFNDDDDDDAEKKQEVPEKKPRLRIVLSDSVSPACKTLLRVDDDGNMVESAKDESPVGQICEVCPEGILLVQDIAKHLEKNRGAALIVDYGQEGTTDSLRGFSKHKQVHFLSRPGEVDVTADVDFGALKHAVNNRPTSSEKDDKRTMFAFGPVEQGRFLASMGAVERVVALVEHESTTDEQAEELANGLETLVTPEQMGQRYKVLAIANKKDDIFAPPGF